MARLLLVLLIHAIAALRVPQCTPRMTLSRFTTSRAAVPCMCDATIEEAPEAVAEEAPEAAAPTRGRGRRSSGPKTKLEELELGTEVSGTVRSVMAFGAFVDIGAVTDGLLHVSEISNEFIKDATEKLNVGDQVTVRIKSINLEKNQMSLTSKEPQERKPRAPRAKVDLSEYENADEKVFITGKVSRVQEYGAFIELKEGVDGLVHISEIQEGGVSSVEDVLTAGQEVQVRIINFDAGQRRIGLSMKPWVAEEDRPKRKPRGGGGGRDFDSDDSEFQMNAEELDELVGGDEVESPFAAAFERLTVVEEAKAAGKKYAPQML